MDQWLKGLGFPVLLWLAFSTFNAWGMIEVDSLSRPELEQRYRVLLEELRCPKCQNQNLKDSNSPISTDLRREIRRLLEEGQSDEEITAFLVDRYGDFVRYRPAWQSNTLVLWLAPGALLIIAVIVLLIIVRRQRDTVKTVTGPLDDVEQQRLAAMLNDSDFTGGIAPSDDPNAKDK